MNSKSEAPWNKHFSDTIYMCIIHRHMILHKCSPEQPSWFQQHNHTHHTDEQHGARKRVLLGHEPVAHAEQQFHARCLCFIRKGERGWTLASLYWEKEKVMDSNTS